jgi:hypothetical protein
MTKEQEDSCYDIQDTIFRFGLLKDDDAIYWNYFAGDLSTYWNDTLNTWCAIDFSTLMEDE